MMVTSGLTSDKFDSLFLQKRFNQIKHLRELRKYDRFLLALGPFIDVIQQLEDHPNLS